MRHKRAKKYHNIISFYERAFDFKPPFRVLCDGNFIHYAATRLKLRTLADLARLVGTIFHGGEDRHIAVVSPGKPQTQRVVLETTDAVVRELREVSTSHGGNVATEETMNLALSLKRQRVGATSRESESYAPDESIRKLVGKENRHRYLVATQDEELRDALRLVPGVPLLFFQRVLIVLEDPSQATLDYEAARNRKKMELSKLERRNLHALHVKQKAGRREDDGASGGEREVRRKKRGLHAENNNNQFAGAEARETKRTRSEGRAAAASKQVRNATTAGGDESSTHREPTTVDVFGGTLDVDDRGGEHVEAAQSAQPLDFSFTSPPAGINISIPKKRRRRHKKKKEVVSEEDF